MIVSEAISKINYALRGIDDDAPTVGTDEYTYWLSVLNSKKDELFRDVKQLWNESFEIRSIGTITASTAPSFELEDDFLAPSDYIYLVTNEDRRVEYRLIKPGERRLHTREAYIAGRNPKVLYVSNEILSTEDIVGAELFLPAHWLPEDMTAANDDLPFPDPNWGVMATAAEIAFNDIIYETKAPDLNEKANSLFRQMAQLNRRGTYDNPRVTPYYMKRIGMR